VRTLKAVPRTLLTLTSGLVATIVLGLVAAVVGHLRPNSPLIQKVIVAWSGAWLVPAGIRIEVEGLDNVDPSKSYVVVSNHLSNVDIMVCFSALPIPIRYLAKKELFSIPILAQAMRAIGIVEVDRAHRGAATIEAVNRQSTMVVERGLSLIIYPEGTRSRSGEPKPFKKGAFTMAAAWQLPVLPVTLEGTRQVWRPEDPWIHPGTVRVRIDPAIPTSGLDRQQVEELRARVERQIVGHFEELRALR
jgi:1-acyl-sn-glycerol-3-phosphate acyltransferase